jgi:hypothetical protein
LCKAFWDRTSTKSAATKFRSGRNRPSFAAEKLANQRLPASQRVGDRKCQFEPIFGVLPALQGATLMIVGLGSRGGAGLTLKTGTRRKIRYDTNLP